MSKQQIISTTGIAADADGLVVAQTFTANLALVLVTSTLSPPRKLIFDASASIASVVFTIVGTDRFGNAVTETVTGVTTTPVLTVGEYATVTSITPSATDAVNTVFVGWDTIAYSRPLMLDHKRTPFNCGFGVSVTGTVDYTIQHTFTDLEVAGTKAGDGVWFDHEDLAGETANQDGNYAFPVEAVRIKQNSGTGTVTLTLLQAGR